LLIVLFITYVSARTMCTKSNLMLRKRAGGQIIGTMSKGDSVEASGSSGGWSKVTHRRLGSGYDSTQYLVSCGSSERSSSSSSNSNSSTRRRESNVSGERRSSRTNSGNADDSTSRRQSSSGGGASGLCSAFNQIWRAYPPDSVTSESLRASIGFGSWISNTCAIRTTMALNAAGFQPAVIGKARWIAKGKPYLIRVLEMQQFMLAAFGSPYAVGDKGRQSGGNWIAPASFIGKAGIVRWSECGFSDATGHFDVWNGHDQTIRGHGYFGRCQRVELWNVCAPRSNPNYSSFLAHMRRTNGCQGC